MKPSTSEKCFNELPFHKNLYFKNAKEQNIARLSRALKIMEVVKQIKY